MLGMTTKISTMKRVTPRCQPEILTIYLTTIQNRQMQLQRGESHLTCSDIWNSDFDPDARDWAVLVKTSV